MAITAFQSTKIGSIELRLHTNISIFPSVNIPCDEYLDCLSKLKLVKSCCILVFTQKMVPFIAVVVSKTYWKCRRRNYIFLDSSERLSAFIEVSDKFNKFSDSSGFRHSFPRLEHILSFFLCKKYLGLPE